MARAHAA
jgi:hypothetical protein